MKENLLKDLILFVRKISKTVILFLIIGILIGFIYDKLKKPYYETNAIATSGLSYFEGVVKPKDFTNPIIDQKEIINIINSLSPVIDSRDYILLSNKLGLDYNIVKDLIMLEAEQLYEIDSENRRQKLSYFDIKVKTYSSEFISDLEEGLIYYINNNKYVKNYHDVFISQTPFLISQIEKELKSLNNMREKDFTSNYNFSVANNKSELVQNQIIDLNEKKLDLEKKFALLSPLSFVQSFNAYSNPKSKLFFRIFIFSFLSILFGLIFSIYKEFK